MLFIPRDENGTDMGYMYGADMFYLYEHDDKLYICHKSNERTKKIRLNLDRIDGYCYDDKFDGQRYMRENVIYNDNNCETYITESTHFEQLCIYIPGSLIQDNKLVCVLGGYIHNNQMLIFLLTEYVNNKQHKYLCLRTYAIVPSHDHLSMHIMNNIGYGRISDDNDNDNHTVSLPKIHKYVITPRESPTYIIPDVDLTEYYPYAVYDEPNDDIRESHLIDHIMTHETEYRDTIREEVSTNQESYYRDIVNSQYRTIMPAPAFIYIMRTDDNQNNTYIPSPVVGPITTTPQGSYMITPRGIVRIAFPEYKS